MIRCFATMTVLHDVEIEADVDEGGVYNLKVLDPITRTWQSASVVLTEEEEVDARLLLLDDYDYRKECAK